jgi:hypothetical protein
VGSTPDRRTEAVAEAAWRWVLAQVRWDDGAWVPDSVPRPALREPLAPMPAHRDGMHSGIGGLGYVLAELARLRRWTDDEQALADAIRFRLRSGIAECSAYDFFDGLVGTIGVLGVLDGDVDEAVDRLLGLATDDGWPQQVVGPPRFIPGARLNDATVGTASVLLGAVWAHRLGVTAAGSLALRAADMLLADAEVVPAGLMWTFVPRRCRVTTGVEMPNFSHGLAGIATALAVAGIEFDRPVWIDAARRGAEQLVTLADTSNDSFRVPHYLGDVDDNDEDRFAHGWCHGGTGTSLLFVALQRAGVDAIAGAAPLHWHRRCLHGVRISGLPERRYPGFWDNDGRCCGTAGVGDAFLDSWQRTGNNDDLDFAVDLADALVERAIIDGDHAWWQFIEHRAAEPQLPPGVGWMQGAAGIAAYLFRICRLTTNGRTAQTTPRLDNWWMLPPT